MRQFQYVPRTYVTEIKETYFEIYTKQVSCPLAILFYTSQTANQYQNICHCMVNCLYLHDSYIIKGRVTVWPFFGPRWIWLKFKYMVV